MALIDRRHVRPQSIAGATALASSRRRLCGRAPAIVQSRRTRCRRCRRDHGRRGRPRSFVIWSRCDRPARMVVEYATTERVRRRAARRRTGGARSLGLHREDRADRPAARPARSSTASLFQDLADLRGVSRPEVGSFVTAPATAPSATSRIAWSADTVGQGWGINPAWGGLRLYETMLKAEPDVFINSGDTIYADQPVVAEVKLDDGTIWKNVVTRGEVEGGADAWTTSAAPTSTTCSDEHMRRFNRRRRRSCSGTTTRCATTGTRHATCRPTKVHGQEHGAHRRARAAGVPRVQPGAGQRRRGGAGLPHRGLRAAGRDVRARPAQLPRPEQRESPAGADRRRRRSPARRSSTG